ncbi:hypothetical protein DSLASN_07190 [Desulfoluna limicola]|uniref:Uncharacterized protein n=1 Tax=Desulfoluna limicola TaxID=2810562 RepID=A0ABM7PC05_9BACT|nr:hypothetical protein DSLASN_07190 [Desulfoluna limicola]
MENRGRNLWEMAWRYNPVSTGPASQGDLLWIENTGNDTDIIGTLRRTPNFPMHPCGYIA